jgi:hypothetical protein
MALYETMSGTFWRPPCCDEWRTGCATCTEVRAQSNKEAWTTPARNTVCHPKLFALCVQAHGTWFSPRRVISGFAAGYSAERYLPALRWRPPRSLGAHLQVRERGVPMLRVSLEDKPQHSECCNVGTNVDLWHWHDGGLKA